MLIMKNKIIYNASKVLENDLNISLPEDYAKFLDKYNGGTYNTQVKIGRKNEDVQGFNGVGDVDKKYSFNSMKQMGVLENYFLPIANNGGDYYCLYLKSDDYGAVYLNYHDLLEKNKKIFSSFTEFIKNCRSKEIGHIPTMEEREKRAVATGNSHLLEKLRPIWREEIEKFSNLVQEEVIL